MSFGFINLGTSNTLNDKKILITCGPTWIPIDDIRIISNKSTGTLGQTLATDCASAGAKVTLLEGPVTRPLDAYAIRIQKFYFYEEFYRLIKSELKKPYDVVIHAAAVSDYKLESPFRRKIKSKQPQLHLTLVPTRKIIHLIKQMQPKTFLVGFKLESDMNKNTAVSATQELFRQGQCDLVVANTTTDQKYCGFIVDKHKNVLAQEKTRVGVSKTLLSIIKQRL